MTVMATVRREQCDGEIRRYGDTYVCGQSATWHIQIAGRALKANSCGHHVAQVLNDFRKAFGDDVQFTVRHL